MRHLRGQEVPQFLIVNIQASLEEAMQDMADRLMREDRAPD